MLTAPSSARTSTTQIEVGVPSRRPLSSFLFPRNNEHTQFGSTRLPPAAAPAAAAAAAASPAPAAATAAAAPAAASPTLDASYQVAWRNWLAENYLSLDHSLATPDFNVVFQDRVFEPLIPFGWDRKRRCYFTKSDKGKHFYHGLRNVIQRTFHPTRSREAIRLAVKAKAAVQSQLGISRLQLPAPPWAAGVTAVSLQSAQSGIQAGLEVDKQISCIINLYNDAKELPMKYTYYKFTTNQCYQDSIVKFLTQTTPLKAREGIESKLRENWARLFPQMGPIVQFWFAETSRRRVRSIQAQVPVFHPDIRLATEIDVVAYDFGKKQLIVIDNKNSKRKYFRVGAQPLLPPYQDHDDSDYNLAQLQVKFSAWLFEVTYRVKVQSLRIFRTQLGEFEEMEIEPWVHKHFPEALKNVVKTMRDMYNVHRFDEEAAPMSIAMEPTRTEEEEEEDEGNDREHEETMDSDDELSGFAARHGMTVLRDETLPQGRGRGGRGGRRSGRAERGGRGRGGSGPIRPTGRARAAARIERPYPERRPLSDE